MPRKPQQARSKATVESIVEAGFVALASHGAANTTTRHIAEIAGISVGSLYEYFANKEAIYQAMNQHLIDEILRMIQGLMPRLVKSDVRNVVSELLFSFRKLLNRDDGRYLRYASHTMNSRYRKQLGPIEKLLTELFMQYLMHHPEMMRLRNIPTMNYIIINGGIFTIIRYLAEPSPSISFEQLVEGLSDMIASYSEVELARLEPQKSPECAFGVARRMQNCRQEILERRADERSKSPRSNPWLGVDEPRIDRARRPGER